jgi:hypothetical protein
MNRLVTLALLQVMTVPIAPCRIQHSLIVLALRAALILATIALGACAGLPTGVVRPPSTARSDLSGTHLAAISRASLASSAAPASGFRLLPTGSEALTARLALAQRAQRTLDLQYYQLAHDHSGLQVLRSLHAAAQRGVRVRLLVDDLYAGGQDALLAGLAALPNIEVRLFNPLPARDGMVASRIVRSLHEFDRINRRMHNKLFVADNAWSISGGRNIADEYFGRAEPAHFIDLDILAAGAVVPEQSAVFDRYWNNAQAYPVASLLPQSASMAALRQDFERAIAKAGAQTETSMPTPGGPAGAQRCALPCELDSGALSLHLAAAQVLADAPDKNAFDDDGASPTVAARYQALLDSAHDEVLLTRVVAPGAVADLRLQRAHELHPLRRQRGDDLLGVLDRRHRVGSSPAITSTGHCTAARPGSRSMVCCSPAAKWNRISSTAKTCAPASGRPPARVVVRPAQALVVGPGGGVGRGQKALGAARAASARPAARTSPACAPARSGGEVLDSTTLAGCAGWRAR